MRDCFVSFILTFRNLCKSTLAYSPEFIIFYFLHAPYSLPKPIPKCQLWTILFWCLEILFLLLHLTVKFWIPRSQWQISHQLQQWFHPGCFHLFICQLKSCLFLKTLSKPQFLDLNLFRTKKTKPNKQKTPFPIPLTPQPKCGSTVGTNSM